MANFVLGAVNLHNPDFVILRWHTTLVAWAVGVYALVVNVFAPRFLDKISKGFLVWNVCGFLIIIITILATNDHKQPASFVFADFVNFSGFGPAYTAMVGLLNTAFGMCCYDAPAHMTEEIKHARKQAPRAIILSVYIGGITGFIFLIAICFCVGNIEETALTSTYVPVLQIFLDSTNSRPASICLCVILLVIGLGSANGLTAEGGRAVFAFARDRGLPFSDTWSKVGKKTYVPVNALILTVVVQLALNSIYFGTLTGFNTVIAIATQGFYVSYAIPLLARLLSLFTSTPHRTIDGMYSLGRLSIPLNVVGLVFLSFISITFNFPGLSPVTPENMNYTIAAVGVIMLISLITWLTTGHRHFRGPESGGVVIEGGETTIVADMDDENEKSR